MRCCYKQLSISGTSRKEASFVRKFRDQGVVFLSDDEVSHYFSAFGSDELEKECRGLISDCTEDGQSDISFDYSKKADGEPNQDDDRSWGLLSFIEGGRWLEAQVQGEGVKKGSLSAVLQEAPNLEGLVKDGVRFLQKVHFDRTLIRIVVTFVLYRLDRPLIMDYHSDAHPALHIPLLCDGLTAKTTYLYTPSLRMNSMDPHTRVGRDSVSYNSNKRWQHKVEVTPTSQEPGTRLLVNIRCQFEDPVWNRFLSS